MLGLLGAVGSLEKLFPLAVFQSVAVMAVALRGQKSRELLRG